jgi:hypothetical protein
VPPRPHNGGEETPACRRFAVAVSGGVARTAAADPRHERARNIMGRTLGLTALVAVLVSAAAAQTQQGYAIKVRKPAAGETFQVEKQEQRSSLLKVADLQGKVVEEKEQKEAEFAVFRETILERPADALRATRLQRHYEKATRTVGDKTTTLPYQGKTVLIEKKDGKYAFRVEGGAELTGADAALLEREFNRKKEEKADFQQLVLPAKPVPVDGTWTMNMGPIIKEVQAQSGMELLPDKTRGSGKLLRVYKEGGHQFGVFDMNLEYAIKSLQAEGGKRAPLQPGAKLVMRFQVDGCIDGGVSSGVTKTTTQMDATTLVPSPEQAKASLSMTIKSTTQEKRTPVEKQ